MELAIARAGFLGLASNRRPASKSLQNDPPAAPPPTPNCLKLWEDFSEVEVRFARVISQVASSCLGWPNGLFIPADPFEIIVWDRYGDLATTEVLAQAGSAAGLEKLGVQEWEMFLTRRFGELVRALSRKVPGGSSANRTGQK